MRIDRRQLMRWGALGAGAAAAGCHSAQHEPEASPTDDADWSVALLADPHVYAERGAAEGVRRCVDHALALKRVPELFITGGDLVYDILATGVAQADAQFALLEQALAGVKSPVYHTLGNHDCLGVSEASGLETSAPGYGKAYFKERLGLERTYYSFDHENWHFVVLDTIDIVERGYRGFVDEEQLLWLADDLKTAQRPTVVIGHIPLFSHHAQWHQGIAGGLSDTLTVANAHEVVAILVEHPVRLVLAGHLHLIESYHFKDIEFANVGAVCGNWWQGVRHGFEEGYVLLEARGDSMSWRYIDYEWEPPRAESGTA